MATTFSNLVYHIVFSTKNRLPLIGRGERDPLYQYIGGIVRTERSWRSGACLITFTCWGLGNALAFLPGACAPG